jgi:hypothetical protein
MQHIYEEFVLVSLRNFILKIYWLSVGPGILSSQNKPHGVSLFHGVYIQEENESNSQ